MNCSVTEIEIDDAGAHVVRALNVTSHLDGLGPG
jgi:hypothetical protein